MRNNHSNFWFLMDKLTDITAEYISIKDNEEERRTSTRLGKWAIKYNIIFLLFFGGGIGLGLWALTLFQSSSVLLGVVLIILAVALVVTSIIFVILAFASEIAQLRLNKKPIGVISLLFTLLIIIAAVVVIIIAVSNEL